MITALALAYVLLGEPAHPPIGSGASIGASWSGVWKGALTNFAPVSLSAPPSATPVEVSLEIGAYPVTDGACTVWKSTYREAGAVKAVKDYRLCRGEGPNDLFIDEGGGVKLPARWLGGALVSAFKTGALVLVTTNRVEGDTMTEDIMVFPDTQAAGEVTGLPPKSLQRLTLTHEVK